MEKSAFMAVKTEGEFEAISEMKNEGEIDGY